MASSEILTIISSCSPFIVVAYLAWKDYRSGSSEIAKKIKEEYKERNGQLEQRIKDLEEHHHENSVEIGKLQAKLEEKEKQITRYEQIFANRNPDLEKVLSRIEQFMSKLNEQTEYQTGILEQRQERDKMIDEASRTHRGAPMMSPVEIKNNKNTQDA